MIYEISSVSNRDSLMLHYYRILRQAKGDLAAIYKEGIGTELTFQLSGTNSDGLVMFTAWVDKIPEGKIPMIEFDITKMSHFDTRWLADIQYLEYTNGQLRLLASPTAATEFKGILYVCDSIGALREELNLLQGRVAELEEKINAV